MSVGDSKKEPDGNEANSGPATQLAGNGEEVFDFRENDDASKRQKIKPKPKAAPSMVKLEQCMENDVCTRPDLEAIAEMCKRRLEERAEASATANLFEEEDAELL